MAALGARLARGDLLLHGRVETVARDVGVLWSRAADLQSAL